MVLIDVPVQKYFANFPNRGSNPNAKSLIPEMLAFSIPEAEIIILKEIIPPRPMDMYKSLSAYSSSFVLDHLFFANSDLTLLAIISPFTSKF